MQNNGHSGGDEAGTRNPSYTQLIETILRKQHHSNLFRKSAGLVAAILALACFSISDASASGICLDSVEPTTEFYIYTGDRDEALMNDFKRPEDSAAKSYWVWRISIQDLIDYMRADFSKWRTPDSSWSDRSIIFEFGGEKKCIAILDERELFVQSATSNGYVVRTLQEFEYERIYDSLQEMRSVY